ncbi:MAG TPA: response regulator transcription factor, partial [Anaerolineales bacterium]|nr:response regulator transcription factor [Anaerolineales bacterium]
MTKIRVFIADDHPVVRDGLATFLSKFDDLDVVGTAGDGSAVLEQVRALHPDVVLTDIRMPGMNGIELARRLRLAHPQMRIIIFTTYDDEQYLYDALRTGAQAYLLKSISHDVLASA